MDLTRPLSNLDEIANGALTERYQLAAQEVLNNILDVNTESDKPRSITIKIDFIPSANRRTMGVKFDVRTKLQPIAPFAVDAMIGENDCGQMSILECLDPQMSIFDENVTSISQFKSEEK